MFRNRSLRLAFASVILFICPGANWSQSREFLVFDSLLYQGKPSLDEYGIHLLRGMNPPSGSNNPDDPVDEARTHEHMKSLREQSGLVYLDYEMWPLNDSSSNVVAESVEKYITVADIARSEAPNAVLGYYGILPCREYWGLVARDPKKLSAWSECNRAGEAIAKHVDVIFPSLYTFYNDQKSWDIYAAGMIKEARRFQKPVYVFLWPEFHSSNSSLRGTTIPAEFWRHQLEFCRSRVDGIVIWGGWQEKWNENAPWWIQTKAFMATLK